MITFFASRSSSAGSVAATGAAPPAPDHPQQAGESEPVARRQQHRLAADVARELAEGDHRTGESHGTDQDADVDFQLVYGLLRPLEIGGGRRIDVIGVAEPQ